MANFKLSNPKIYTELSGSELTHALVSNAMSVALTILKKSLLPDDHKKNEGLATYLALLLLYQDIQNNLNAIDKNDKFFSDFSNAIETELKTACTKLNTNPNAFVRNGIINNVFKKYSKRIEQKVNPETVEIKLPVTISASELVFRKSDGVVFLVFPKDITAQLEKQFCNGPNVSIAKSEIKDILGGNLHCAILEYTQSSEEYRNKILALLQQGYGEPQDNGKVLTWQIKPVDFEMQEINELQFNGRIEKTGIIEARGQCDLVDEIRAAITDLAKESNGEFIINSLFVGSEKNTIPTYITVASMDRELHDGLLNVINTEKNFDLIKSIQGEIKDEQLILDMFKSTQSTTEESNKNLTAPSVTTVSIFPSVPLKAPDTKEEKNDALIIENKM
ncbi:MAG: hypothetical protein Tsb005_00850 [Gammaproteobacteria bacterium]